jgi:hypothetical protein
MHSIEYNWSSAASLFGFKVHANCEQLQSLGTMYISQHSNPLYNLTSLGICQATSVSQKRDAQEDRTMM